MSHFRSDIPALTNKYYFNYGGQGPLPTSSLSAITASWERIQELGPFTNNVWPYISNEVNETKAKIARFCGVSHNQISLTENVTSGCILPLWGLPFSKGDRLLIGNCEHPGVVSACRELALRKGLIVDILDVESLREGVKNNINNSNHVIQRLKKEIRPTTKLVVLSHLLWNTGEIMPIELISDLLLSYQSQPFLLVDAAQSFGQIPINKAAAKSDIYAFTGHKWAFGPEGLGGVILSERVLRNSRPTVVGWKSLSKEGSIYQNNPNPFHEDGRRFEIATSCTPLLAGLRNSINLLESEGTDIERHKRIKSLSKQLWEELNQIKGIETILKAYPPAGVVSFCLESSISPKKVVKLLGEESLWIRVLEDPIWLRACVHITTTGEEIKKLIKSLKRIANEYS